MSTTTCPCGNKKTYDSCCGLYISGKQHAPTAEALMRSRYSAYVKQEIDYVERTHDKSSKEQFDRAAAEAWSKQTDWKGLEIKATELGQPGDAEGTVEFVAHFNTAGVEQAHHEISLFRKEDDHWVYVDGKIMRVPVKRSESKVGRNDPCSCGSGKKYKKCCGAN